MTSNLDRLSRALYGRDVTAREYLGGSDARILGDAALEIEAMRAELERMRGLVRGAIRNAGRWRRSGCELRFVVKDTFAIGKSSAAELCEEFDVDPCREVPLWECPRCLEDEELDD